ncbi:hypothetical protein INT47_003834 [Mucor saturninus]|uniref:CxC1-like cysteine cluster associated with KDZ transposases domain-containing protein n=1 Tax=Mucor saturninus TaxID=64648 RepID=A0A8H7UQ65_9FUNG|nr:hypothetical protein INT47_003834 [Mucor saturninus]
MGKSKIALWREMEQFKREMLLNPGYELSESEIASFQPSPPPKRQPLPPDDENNTTVVLHNCTMDPTPALAPRKRRRIRIRSPGPIVKVIPAKVSPAEAKKKRAIGYQRKLEALANKRGKQGGLPSTEIVSPVAFDCRCGSEKVLLTKIVRMYFFHAIKDVSVCYCSCKPLAEALILMGMLPASPTDPKNAIHLGLLGYFNEVRNTLKSSSEGITKFEEVVNERSLLKDQAMCCPACLSRDSIHLMDRIFITMDRCFSMKCQSKASPLDRLNLVNPAENAWVKPECVELYKNEKTPKDALINENTFRAAGNASVRNEDRNSRASFDRVPVEACSKFLKLGSVANTIARTRSPFLLHKVHVKVMLITESYDNKIDVY